MYIILIDDYFTSCLAIFSILIEIVLSLQRYLILINKATFQKISHKWIICILFLISLLYYLPMLFRKNILSTKINYLTNGTVFVRTSYSIINTDFGSSPAGKTVPIVLTIIRIFLGTFLLTFVNIINTFKFRKRFNKRMQIKLKMRKSILF